MAEPKNPSEMTDEELNAELGIPIIEPKEPPKPPVDEEPPVPTPPAPVIEEEEEPEEPEETEEDDQEEPKTPPAPSRREQLRIHDLLTKYPPTQPTAKPKPAQGAMDFEKDIDADPEMRQRLVEDRQTAADTAYNQGLETSKSIQFHTRLEIDAPRVEAKYPQLDKDSADFNPRLANTVNTMFLTTVGFDKETDRVRDPSIRYADYVEAVFELANEIAGEKTENTRKVVRKQAAQTGLRPDGSSTKRLNLNKSPDQMTDEELDAAISQTMPRR